MKNYPETSVIDIAMGVLSNMNGRESVLEEQSPPRKGVEEIFKESTSAAVPDIKDMEVPEDYVSYILEGGSITSQRSKKAIKETKKPIKESKQSLNEEKMADLVTRLSNLVLEAKNLIQEMTSCGMTGTNQMPSKKTGTKEIPPKNNRRFSRRR